MMIANTRIVPRIKITDQTKTEETKAAYLYRVNQIIKKAETKDPLELASWLTSKSRSLRYNSIRQYRAALKYYFEQEKSKNINNPQLVEKIGFALRNIEQIQHGNDDSLPSFTSSTKAKYITLTQLKKLEKYCLSMPKANMPLVKKLLISQNQYALYRKRAYYYLLAGIATGLRPVEWFKTTFVDKKDAHKLLELDKGLENWYRQLVRKNHQDLSGYLLVENSKNTNGRSTGKYRIVPVMKNDVDNVKTHMQYIKDSNNVLLADGQNTYLKQCQNALSRASKKLFPNSEKPLSLYSARHQYCANYRRAFYNSKIAKGIGGSRFVLAMLMGHCSQLTVGAHYGKAKNAHRANLKPVIDLLNSTSDIKPPDIAIADKPTLKPNNIPSL